MTIPKLSTHGPLRVLTDGDLVAIQPSDALGASETCSINLSTGEVHVGPQPKLGTQAKEVLALIGVLKLRGGSCVALVTGAQQVSGA
jgi:hypothetical protein